MASHVTSATSSARVLPYGAWPSAITAEQLAVGGHRLSAPSLVGDHLWWVEGRADEGGRQALVRTAEPVATEDGAADVDVVTVLPAPFDARSRVHEYGGAAWTTVPAELLDDGDERPLVLFVDFADQRIRRFREGGEPEPISPAGPEVVSAGGPSLRWAQPVVVPGGLTAAGAGPEVWWICEDHTADRRDPDGAPHIERYVAAVPLDGSAAEDPARVRRVTPSSRFVAHPRLSPDGARLAWISWEHPRMPWDGTELHVGRLVDGVVAEEEVVDGDEHTSVLQPEWRDAERLVHLSDRSGWWNPWGWSAATGPTQLLREEREHAGPLWQLGEQWLTLLDPDTALIRHGTAVDQLGVLDLSTGAVAELHVPHTAIAGAVVREDGLVAFTGSSPHQFSGVQAGRLINDGYGWRITGLRTLRSSRRDAPDPALLPVPEPITVTAEDGHEVHAVLYRPHQEGIVGPEDELPPFIAEVHGGPTGQTVVGLSPAITYWTSRGIGVVDVDYGGSTGYGRAYRDRLKGRWGVVDVEDTVTVMRHLAAEGIADGDRLAIQGGSAGGWTTLACLTRTDVFAAGVSSFGVADAVGLAEDTHDFESRYLDQMIGKYPEEIEVYRERAPLSHVDSLSCPVLLLQGEEDRIVPPSQAERFRDALAAKGISHAYLLFAGEQHGFRKAENIITSFEASLSFYGQVLGFEPPEVLRLTLTR